MKTPQNQLKLEHKNLAKKLHRAVHEANNEYHIIEEGDRIMECLSGGKDSYTMLDLVLYVKEHAQINFEIVAVNLDQKQPGFPAHILPAYLKNLGVEYKIITKDTYSIVMDKTPEGATMCSLCSRLRRGTLYSAADELGCNKLALGHHREDMIETLFLNMFFIILQNVENSENTCGKWSQTVPKRISRPPSASFSHRDRPNIAAADLKV